MERVQLGKSGIEVSRICLGCWQAGIGGWTDVTDEASIATIYRALDLGINFLDTAEGDGGGHSEQIIGKALKGRREEVVIATKVSHNHLQPDSLREALERSLRDLQTDYVDLYQIHWPTRKTPVEVPLEEMTKVKEEGKIRAVGVSNFDVPLLERCVATTQLDSLQPPFSLVWREIDEGIRPFCMEHGVSIMAYSPMAQGLILGKYKSKEELPDDCRSSNVLTRDGVFEKVLDVSNLVVETAQKYGKTPAQVALNWCLCTPGVTNVIAGARRPEQIADSAGADGWQLEAEDYERLSTAGQEAFAPIPKGETLWHWKPDGFEE